MLMHELIDREDPRCLYCKSEVDFKYDGGFDLSAVGGAITNYEVLECRSCKEIFIIHSKDENSETIYTGFRFTCKDLTVDMRYDNKTFNIYKQKILSASIIVPSFDVDFSDKKKLFLKLKTLILFS